MRSSTVWRAGLPIGVVAILLLSLGFGLSAPTARAAGTESLTVTVGTQFAFTLSSNEVQPGDNVTVTIVQTSTTAHTFTLLNAPNFQFNWSSSASDGPTKIAAFLAAHHPLVNVTIPDMPTTVTTSFIAPPFGLYEYLCLEAGHFAAGMWGILGSGEAGSGGATVDNGPGTGVFLISGTIASLVVVTLVLAFVVGKREGAKHEMPPERLGYPEPPSSPPSTPPAK